MKHRILFWGYVIVCTFFSLSSGTVKAQLTLQDSLVLSLQFTGNTDDSSGNQNDGTGMGTSLTADRFGNPNSAIFLDGVNDYVLITDNQKLKPQFPVTVTAWVKIEDYDRNLVVWNDWQEDVYHGFWMNIVNGEVSVAFGDGGPVGSGSRRSKLGLSMIPLQTWTHLAGIIRGPTDMEIFINGQNDCGTYSGSGGPLAYSSSPGRMGQVDPFAAANTSFDFFHGSIDDVRIYSRELSVEEIRTLAGANPLTVQSDTICLGDSTILTAPSGYSNYSWSPGTGLSCSNCPGPIASPTQSTSYTVLLTKHPGCFDTLTVNLQVDTCCLPPEIQSINVTHPDCFGGTNGSIQLQTSSIVTPVSYSLNGGAFQPGSTFSGLSAGTYTITTRNEPDCEKDTIITLIDPPALSLMIDSVTNVNCPADSTGIVYFSAAGGTPPYGYSISGIPSTSTSQISNLPAGSYVITVTDIFGCTANAQFSISSSSQLATVVTTVSSPSCVGFSDGGFTFFTSGGSAPYSYVLNGISQGNGTTVSGINAGTYLLTTTDATGCSQNLSVFVPEPDSLIPNITVQQEVSCFGLSDGAIIAEGLGGQPPYSFAWSNGPTTPTYASLSAGTYNVTLTDDNGCIATTSFTLTQPDSLITRIDILSNVLCNGEDSGIATGIATGGTPPYQFWWNSTLGSDTITSLQAGLALLRVVDGNGCETNTSALIQEPDPIRLTIEVLRDNLCFGERKGQATVAASGGTGPFTFLWNQALNGDTVTILPAGVTEVLATDQNGCEVTDSVFINQPDEIKIAAELAEPLCHDSEDGQILVFGEGGVGPYTFSWLSPPSGSGPLLSDLGKGEYLLSVTDQNQCEIDTLILLPGPDQLVLDSVELIPAFCGREAGSILVMPGGGTPSYQFSWGNGDRDSLIDNLGSGSYTVVIEDQNGCLLEQTISLSGTFPVDAIAEVDSSGALPFTEDHPIQFRNFSTGEGSFSWQFGDGNGSIRSEPLHVYSEPGEYMVILTVFDPDSACPDRDTLFLSLAPSSRLFIPSGFSPNGDGVNDLFSVSAVEVADLSVFIFSRWGQQVARLQSVNEGWDGKDMNGRDVPEGVYVYKLDAVTVNGQQVTRSGTITLIR